MKETAETLTAAHGAAAARLPHRWSERWLQPKGAMWPGGVVVGHVLREHGSQVPLIEDEHVVQALGTEAVSYTHLTLPTTPYV